MFDIEKKNQGQRIWLKFDDGETMALVDLQMLAENNGFMFNLCGALGK